MLEDYRWLTSSAGIDAWRTVLANDSSVSPGQIRALVTCSESRARLLIEQRALAHVKAKRKVHDPASWLWTSQLLEQASDETTAEETARDFPSSEAVIDVCCGAGVDAVTLGRSGRSVLALDQDPIACLLTAANASMHGLSLESACRSWSGHEGPLDAFLHLDPDRRANGTRTIEPQAMSPTWDVIAPVVDRYRGVSIKVAPGFRADPNFPWQPASPPHVLRWLSVAGSVRQQRWYWNIERWPVGAKVLSSHSKRDGWQHEMFSCEEFEDRLGLDGGWGEEPIGPYVADQDPVVRASELTPYLARRLNLGLIGSESGYCHGPECTPHPMLRWFRVLDVLSMDSKKMRAAARGFSVRAWELKSRGVDIDLERMQRVLFTDPSSTQKMTILFTRQGKRHIAIFAERISDHEGSDAQA